jgi:hypothetical protein
MIRIQQGNSKFWTVESPTFTGNHRNHREILRMTVKIKGEIVDSMIHGTLFFEWFKWF